MTNKNISLYSLFFLLLLAMVPAQAQDTTSYLSPEEAVQLALDQNLGIQGSRQQQEISRRNYSLGNAGFLPTVSAVAAKGWSYQNSEQTDRAGESRQINGARPSNFNWGVAARWTLLDGLGMFRTYERLRLEYEAGAAFTEQAVNDLVADVTALYYQHTLQQQRLELWLSTLELSEQRLRLAKDRYEVGKTSKQEYLAALVDYNADKAALLAQQEALQNTRHQLNRLMGLPPLQPIQTMDTLQADSSMVQVMLTPQPVAQNPQYRALQLSQSASEQLIKEQQSTYWPTISADLGYNFARQRNPAGFFLYNQTTGFTYGFSASWLLFDGFVARRNVQIARIQSRLAELSRRQLELDLLTTQADATVAYRNQWQQIALEEENLEYARQSAAIALDRYRLGIVTPLELRAAQQNAQQAALRLLNAVYELKLAELELLRVSGQLQVGAQE